MKVIAYTYDADVHCEKCMLKYARSVPYHKYQFNNETGNYSDADIQYYDHAAGIINVANAVKFNIIRDREGNAIHPIFSTDEWWDDAAGFRPHVLSCTDCGKELDRVEVLP